MCPAGTGASSPALSPGCAQRRRRVCTGCPQACAQHDWTLRRPRTRLSDLPTTTGVRPAAPRQSGVQVHGEVMAGERGRDRSPGRGLRSDPAARRGRGAVRARRDAAVQGRDLRRDGDHPAGRPLPARAPDRARGHPRPVRPGRACRRGHRRRPAEQARRAGPGRRPQLPAHADRVGAHRGQRRLLRPDRPGAGDPAPPGRGRHPDRPARLLRRRRRRRTGGPGPGRGLRGHRAPGQRGLPVRCPRSCPAPWTRSRRSAAAAAA